MACDHRARFLEAYIVSARDQIVSRSIWAALIVVLGAVSVAYMVNEIDRGAAQVPLVATPQIRIPLPDFAFTERSGKSVSKADLSGQVWVADFIFTSCAGPCPMMSTRMSALGRDLAAFDKLKLVSFSVDPERDTPEVLRTYADQYNADPQQWLFLTGPMDRIYDIAIDGFKITVEAARQNNQIIHDTRFMLVDHQGVIRGYYHSASEQDLQRLRQDAATLLRETEE